MKSLFAPLAMKIAAVIGAALLIVIVVLWLQNRSLRATVEELRNANAACEAARAVQNAAVDAARAEGERQRQAFADALESGNAAILEAQGRVRVVRQTAPNNCPTPREIMGAGL